MHLAEQITEKLTAKPSRAKQSLIGLLIGLFFFLNTTKAATFTTNNAAVTWNNSAHWTLNSGTSVLNYPVAGDIVNIQANQSVTVTANAACASITFSAGTLTANRTLTINASVTLDVSGTIAMASPAANFARTISVSGILNAGSLTMPTTGGAGQDCVLSIATGGVANISGNITMAGAFNVNHIDMAGTAVINIGGNIGSNAGGTAAGGGFTTPTTVNFNGTLPQNFFPATANAITTFKVNNAAGVIMRVAQTVTTLTIGDVTSNSLFKDSGNTITCTGTLNLNNGSTYRLGRYSGTGGTATAFPAFTTRNIDLGTTIEYAHSNAAQTVANIASPGYAHLTLSAGAAQSKTIAAGTLTVRGNLTIGANATFLGSTNNPIVNLGGNFTNSGTYTSGTALFTMNGTANQSITSVNTLTFNGGLTIGNSGGAIVTNTNATIAITTGDVMTINNGSIFYAGANVINGAGTFTLASGGTLGIGSADGISTVGTNTGNVQVTTARNYNTGANYIYNGALNQSEGNGLPATVNNLTVDNTGGGGNNTVTMVSNVSVSGNLSVLNGVLDLVNFTANRGTAGGTLTVSNGTRLIIGGTNTLPSNYSTHVIGATSTIEYDGTTNTVAALNSSQSYGDLVISASGATTTNNFSVSGTMTVTGSMIASAGTVTMNNVASSISNSGTLTFFNLTVSATPTAQSQYNTSYSVAGALTINGGVTFAPTGGTITMSGAGSSIANTGTKTFNNLTIAATPSAQSQYNTSFSVIGALTVNGGITFAPTGGTITMSDVNSSIANSGTATFQNLIIAATPTAQSQYNTSFSVAAAFTVNGGVTFAPTGGTITMSAVGSSIANTGTKIFSNLTIAATPTAQSQYNTSFSVDGTLTINGGITFAPTGGTITMSDAASSIANSGTTTFQNLIIAVTPTAQTQYNTSFNVAATFTINGGVTFAPTSGTITMNNAASAISNGGSLSFNNLTISATPTAQSQYNTSFSVGGTLATSGAITFAPAGGTITMSGSAGSISNASGTLTFNDLTVSGTTVSSTGNFAVAGTMSVTGVFNPAATSIISGAGTLTGTGTVNVTRTAATPSFGAQYTITTKTLVNLTVDFNGAGAQTVDAQDYGTLVISTNGTRTVTFVSGGTIRVSNVFTPTATTTTYVVTGNTFEYNGSGAQTITAFTYNNLIISNAGAKSVLAGTTVNCQTITINDNAVLTLPDTSVFNVQG